MNYLQLIIFFSILSSCDNFHSSSLTTNIKKRKIDKESILREDIIIFEKLRASMNKEIENSTKEEPTKCPNCYTILYEPLTCACEEFK